MRLAPQRPDALVLGVGGIVGRAWTAGLLAGIEERTGWDFRDCASFTGTSAGSIVAAVLAAGHRPEAPAVERREDGAGAAGRSSPFEELLATGARFTLGALRPAAGLLLRAAAPAGALARAAMLARAPRGQMSLADLARRMERLDVDFDGRLRIVCVELATGRRTVFGDPGAPPAAVADAVQASCAIPGVFPPIQIDGRDYVDGGVWSPTNLDVAPVQRGEQVLCLNPTGRSGLFGLSLASGLAGFARSRAAIEEETLRARGVAVTTIGPDRAAADEMGPNPMDPRRANAGAQAGYRQGLRLAA